LPAMLVLFFFFLLSIGLTIPNAAALGLAPSPERRAAPLPCLDFCRLAQAHSSRPASGSSAHRPSLP
jgi:hypothetical protein